MDWNPLNSSLFTGAGLPWAPTDLRPEWYTSLNWDPRHSEFFREVYLPGVEGLLIGAATMATGGAAGVAIGAAMAVGAQQLDAALGIEQKTFFGQFAPLAGALGGGLLSSFGVGAAPVAGAEVPAWISGGTATASAGATAVPAWISGATATAQTYAPLLTAAGATVAATQPKPAAPAPTAPKPATTYYVTQQAEQAPNKTVLFGGLLLLALALKK